MSDYLNVLSKHELDQRLHGLSGVEIDHPRSGWSLGGSETGMESSASRTPPAKSVGLFQFHLPLLEPPFHLSSFFFFLVALLLLLLVLLRPLLLLLLWPLRISI